MTVYRIGIIDDDRTKVTQIITHLHAGWDVAHSNKLIKYASYKFDPCEIEIHSEPIDTLHDLKKNNVDCVLIDYKLSSYASISYTGIGLAKLIESTWEGFPIFILTSYEEEIYANEIFDVYQIFDFYRYLNDKDERIELNTKIVEQILKHSKECEAWEKELIELLPRAGESVVIDERIMQLDGYIEGAIDAVNRVPKEVKAQLGIGKIDQLLDKLDEIIGRT